MDISPEEQQRRANWLKQMVESCLEDIRKPRPKREPDPDLPWDYATPPNCR